MREKILNMPASENTNVHRSVLENEKNIHGSNKEKLDGSKRIRGNAVMSQQQNNKANDRSWTRASGTSS